MFFLPFPTIGIYSTILSYYDDLLSHVCSRTWPFLCQNKICFIYYFCQKSVVSSAGLSVVTYTCITSLEKANVGRFKLEVSLSSKNRIDRGSREMAQWLRVLATLVEDMDLVPRTIIRQLKPSVMLILRWSGIFLDSVITSPHDVHIHILRHAHTKKSNLKKNYGHQQCCNAISCELGWNPKPSHLLGKCSTTKLYTNPEIDL